MTTDKATPKLEVHKGLDYVHIYDGDKMNDSEHPFAIVPDVWVGEKIVDAVNSHDILQDTIQWNILRMKEAAIMLAESYKVMTGKPITMEPGTAFTRLMDAIKKSEEVLK